MLAPALAHLVKGIVEHPDDVSVTSKGSPRGEVLEVRDDEIILARGRDELLPYQTRDDAYDASATSTGATLGQKAENLGRKMKHAASDVGGRASAAASVTIPRIPHHDRTNAPRNISASAPPCACCDRRRVAAL